MRQRILPFFGLFLLGACQPLSAPPDFSRPSPTKTIVSPSPQESSEPLLTVTQIEVVAGSGEIGAQDGSALESTFNEHAPRDLSLCYNPRSEIIYILDSNTVRQLTPDGRVMKLAGSSKSGFQDGIGGEALFHNPSDCVVDSKDRIWIADLYNHRLRQMTPDGTVITIVDSLSRESKDGLLSEAEVIAPYSMAIDKQDRIFFTEPYRLRKIEDGRVSTLIIQDITSHKALRAPSAFTFDSSFSIVLSPENHLFVLDIGTDRVLRITPPYLEGEIFATNTSQQSVTLATSLAIGYLPEKKVVLISEGGREIIYVDQKGQLHELKDRNGNTVIFNRLVDFQAMNDNTLLVSDANQIKRIHFE